MTNLSRSLTWVGTRVPDSALLQRLFPKADCSLFVSVCCTWKPSFPQWQLRDNQKHKHLTLMRSLWTCLCHCCVGCCVVHPFALWTHFFRVQKVCIIERQNKSFNWNTYKRRVVSHQRKHSNTQILRRMVFLLGHWSRYLFPTEPRMWGLSGKVGSSTGHFGLLTSLTPQDITEKPCTIQLVRRRRTNTIDGRLLGYCREPVSNSLCPPPEKEIPQTWSAVLGSRKEERMNEQTKCWSYVNPETWPTFGQDSASARFYKSGSGYWPQWRLNSKSQFRKRSRTDVDKEINEPTQTPIQEFVNPFLLFLPNKNILLKREDF